jgi:hypothetical protein
MPRPRADMDTLLAESLRAATYFLTRNAEFFPFAVTLGADGRVRHVQEYTAEEQPDAEALIGLAQEALRELAAEGKVRAVALVSDVRIRRPEAGEQDAIRVQLEHARDRPVTCFLPYRLEGGAVVRGELFAEGGSAVVFPTSEG